MGQKDDWNLKMLFPTVSVSSASRGSGRQTNDPEEMSDESLITNTYFVLADVTICPAKKMAIFAFSFLLITGPENRPTKVEG